MKKHGLLGKIAFLFMIACMPMVTTMAQSAEQNAVSDSSPLKGLWRMLSVRKGEDGKMVLSPMNYYKMYNGDQSFCTLIGRPSGLIYGVSGSYQFDSDSTFTEHIDYHSSVPEMVNTDSRLKFKMNENVALIMYYNTYGATWVPELWVKVVPGEEMFRPFEVLDKLKEMMIIPEEGGKE